MNHYLRNSEFPSDLKSADVFPAYRKKNRRVLKIITE